MLVLFDHGTPKGLARELRGHTVTAAVAMGWDRLTNGDLLRAAEASNFQVLVTTDRRIRYQQNMANRQIAIVVLSGTTKWSRVRLCCDRIAEAVDAAVPGAYAEVWIPFK